MVSVLFCAAILAAQTPVTISASTLETYAGTYQIAPNVNLVVSLNGDQLTGQLPGSPKFPLAAQSQAKFLVAGVGAEIEFVKDQQGADSHYDPAERQRPKGSTPEGPA